jgi:hypothetical protein
LQFITSRRSAETALGGLCGHSSRSSVSVVLHRLQTTWRNWRERRHQYQVERALYKAGGHGDARHGGFEGGANHDPGDLSDLHGGGVSGGAGVNPGGGV